MTRAKPGGLYLGVGPEQNFTYIAALRPRMAFIVDIRRGNLLEHLLYKALMELSADRAEFLSRLFAPRRGPRASAASTVAAALRRLQRVPAERTALSEHLKAVSWTG